MIRLAFSVRHQRNECKNMPNGEMSPEEIMTENVRNLGEKLGQTFTFFHDEFLDLLMQWDLYVSFFGENEERVNLLNSVSGSTSYWIEKALFESTLLGLRKISENLKGRPEDSQVSIDRLLYFVEEGEGKKELRALAKNVRKKCEFAKNWADKKIAHNAWDVRTGRSSLETASRSKVNDALEHIARFIQKFGKIYLNTTYIFDVIKPLGGDEIEFLETVYEGKKILSERESRRVDAINARDWQAARVERTRPKWLETRYAPDWRRRDFDI